MERGVTRRTVLGRAAFGAVSAVLASRWASAPAARGALVPLPTAAQIRADIQRMVDFGPRLTGSDAHDRYLDWLEREFVAAGLELSPCDVYATERWEVQRFGLDFLSGPAPGPAKIAAYYPRSKETPAGGVTGSFVYAGVAPAPSLSGADVATLEAALARYPADLVSWLRGLVGTLTAGDLRGSILLVDLPIPVPLTSAFLLPLATALSWPGHSVADWVTGDYKRPWILPGLGVPLAPFQALGAAGVVFILDSSHAALAGGYLPFGHGFEPLPALYVDRDEGERLRALSGARARLTLTATRQKVPTRSVTATLPGASSEAIVLDTHTDGQNFVEENGGVGLVHLARHFASLPRAQRPKRTLVFSAWPGHMVADLPGLQGWIDDHPDIVRRTAAAITIEHLGCSEWIDSVGSGYHATGETELYGVWTTQGKMFALTRDAVVAHGLPHQALLRPPVQFGVGGPFQSAGVPQIGFLAGPTYLVTISPGGEMDKLDADLAARQVAWLADLVGRIDPIPAAALRQGDPTLGSGGGGKSRSHPAACGPAAAAAGHMGVTLDAPSRRRLRRGGWLRGRLTLG
ncbi:MAG: hypothetical protein JWN32_796, partial [Solirubrobacterales bacterium]|nr:hypothetical protein [Solirubrobacterales bacterium]